MKKRKNMVIVCLLLAVLCLSVAYAAFATTLKINGNAKISSTEWNVEITGITADTPIGNADAGTPTYTKTSATFDAKLVTPGDQVTYHVTIQNKGTTTARFKKATWTLGTTTAPITYTTPEDSVFVTLNAGDTVTFDVVATYDENASGEITAPNDSKTLTGEIIYEQ